MGWDEPLRPSPDSARERHLEIAASQSTGLLRTYFSRTTDGTTVLELEWRSGCRDGERFAAALSPAGWDYFVQTINDANEQL